MLIDWFTVAAQALNFLILVWLMRQVLYKPILAAIDAREMLVAAQLADAAATRKAADVSMKEFTEKNLALDRDRVILLAKATEQAKAQCAHLLDLARASADALQARRYAALQDEMQSATQALGGRVRKAFFALARRAFKDLADGSVDEQIASCFCGKLRIMSDPDKSRLLAAINASSDPATVRSAFALPPRDRDALQTALNETFQRQIVVRFETVPQMIGGIQLTVQGQRAEWSIDGYLTAFEQEAGIERLTVPALNPETEQSILPPRVALKAAV